MGKSAKKSGHPCFILGWKGYCLYNNYSMSPSWIWSDKITNSRYALVGYNHFISNKGKWNNCFSKFSNRVLPPIFICTILQSGKFLNLEHHFPYDVKLRLLAHSWSFLANQKAGNAIVGAENLLKWNKQGVLPGRSLSDFTSSRKLLVTCKSRILARNGILVRKLRTLKRSCKDSFRMGSCCSIL